MADILKIEDGVLEECTDKNATSVVIPSGVTEICKDAFRECETLSDVKFGGTIAEWKSVKKGRGWHKDSPAKSVICTDGKVKL